LFTSSRFSEPSAGRHAFVVRRLMYLKYPAPSDASAGTAIEGFLTVVSDRQETRNCISTLTEISMETAHFHALAAHERSSLCSFQG